MRYLYNIKRNQAPNPKAMRTATEVLAGIYTASNCADAQDAKVALELLWNRNRPTDEEAALPSVIRRVVALKRVIAKHEPEAFEAAPVVAEEPVSGNSVLALHDAEETQLLEESRVAGFNLNDAISAAQIEAGCDCLSDGCALCIAPNGEPLNAIKPAAPAINRKRKYFEVVATKADMKTVLIPVFKDEVQTMREAFEAVKVIVDCLREEGYKFPSFDFSSIKKEHDNGFAFMIQSDWREPDETFVMVSTFCFYPGVKY